MSGYITPTIPFRPPGPVSDVITNNGVYVKFVALSGDECSFMIEPNTTTLKDIQPILVKWLGASFPKHSAFLTNARNEIFMEFIDRPFRHAEVGDRFVVTIGLTTDMFFYDLARKDKSKVATHEDTQPYVVGNPGTSRSENDGLAEPSVTISPRTARKQWELRFNKMLTIPRIDATEGTSSERH